MDNQGSKRKSILLITSGQPSLNPRLVKEADALVDAGYQVTVLYAYWNEWGTKADEDLLNSKKWRALRVAGHPRKRPVTFFISRLIHKFASISWLKFNRKYFADLAVARSSFFLIRAAKKFKADLYIGHNLGALAATFKAANANDKPSGFDAEDLHRFESSNDDQNADVVLKSYIENKYIPQITYTSASSDSIANAYLQLFPGKNFEVLLNVFPLFFLPVVSINKEAPIRLVWFSQTVGFNRGIEDIVNGLQHCEVGNFELHLLGLHSPRIVLALAKLNLNGSKIYYYDPIDPNKLQSFVAQFDIGLALEPGFSKNNDFALSNKLFTYMQAGLAVIATDTTAQQTLIKRYPKIGKLYKKYDSEMLADILKHYYDNRDELHEAKLSSRDLAINTMNWEEESKKFIAHIKAILPN